MSSLDDAINAGAAATTASETLFLVLDAADKNKPPVRYEIRRCVAAEMSSVIKGALEFDANATEVPIAEDDQMTAEILGLFVKWMNMNYGRKFAEIPKPLTTTDWSKFMTPDNAEFFNGMTFKTLYQVINSSKKLEVDSLLHLAAAVIAAIFKRKNVEQIKEITKDENLNTCILEFKDSD